MRTLIHVYFCQRLYELPLYLEQGTLHTVIAVIIKTSDKFCQIQFCSVKRLESHWKKKQQTNKLKTPTTTPQTNKQLNPHKWTATDKKIWSFLRDFAWNAPWGSPGNASSKDRIQIYACRPKCLFVGNVIGQWGLSQKPGSTWKEHNQQRSAKVICTDFHCFFLLHFLLRS